VQEQYTVWNNKTNIVVIWLQLCGTISSVWITVCCTVYCQGWTTLLIAGVYWPCIWIICLIVMEILYCLHEIQIKDPATSRDILVCHCCPHKSIPFLFGNDCCCFQEDLDALQGMKCQAPYRHEWGDVSYHNALVCAVEPASSVHSMNQIQVLVCS